MCIRDRIHIINGELIQNKKVNLLWSIFYKHIQTHVIITEIIKILLVLELNIFNNGNPIIAELQENNFRVPSLLKTINVNDTNNLEFVT